jgi:hypothetical protein
MRLPEQVTRLALVAGVLVVAVLGVRFAVIPRSLVSAELHRRDTVDREVARPVKFAGSQACQDCHEDVAAKKGKSYHRGLACGGCHGPAVVHAEDPGALKPPAPRDRKFCPVCHDYDPARPTGFPQINQATHNPTLPCIDCHDPHDPEPPVTPQECSACHAQIARTKVVSSHALVACTSCHVAPELHRRTPRAALPTKPVAREFCATCHGAQAKQTRAPKVDMSQHGGRFLCWECHYPHLPEGRG